MTGVLDIEMSDGNVRIGDITSGSVDTDAGILFDRNTIKSGVFTESNGDVISLAINTPQITARSITKPGAIFRLDTRPGLITDMNGDSHAFVIKRYASNSS